MAENQRIAYRICPFCEATCGLKLTLEGREVVDVRGDADDPFSRGYICPKGTALKHLHEDPDRLSTPLIKENGVHREASFDEAFALIDQKLLPLRETYGADAIALYNGNPGAHNLSHMLYGGGVAAALGSRNRYSVATADQMPRHMASGLMFGTWATVPVPDIDRCDLLVLLGTNPIVSNGSMWTVPDFRGRLKDLQARGGEMVVIDPRRTRTADLAEQHFFITPGTDAYLLAAILNVLFTEGLADAKQVADYVAGMAELAEAVQPFTPQQVAGPTGIAANDITALARKIAATDRCAVHGRIGVNTQKFGSLNSFLIDAINVTAGNLDREGGAMFPKAAAFAANTRGAPGVGRGIRPYGKPSRVRGLPSVMGEYPVATLADEIETEGDGQIRGLITMAGNPILSNPNGARLAKAFAGLDFMVSVDIYLNETTRFADVILPGSSHLEQSHYAMLLNQFSVRNVARWSAPVLHAANVPPEWQTLLRLSAVLRGMGPNPDIEALDEERAQGQLKSQIAEEKLSDAMAALKAAGRKGPDRVIDIMLRMGAYGDKFGENPEGISLDKVMAAEHGMDLGALAPRVPEILRTPTGKIELAPDLILGELKRADAELAQEDGGALRLIGRRDLRSNNSWFHNLPTLIKGKNRCTLMVHPLDAARLGLDGEKPAIISSAQTGHDLTVEVEITDQVMEGVVSLPHGFGHDAAESRMGVAAAHAGVNSNLLSDEYQIEPLTGTSVLNGHVVQVRPAV